MAVDIIIGATPHIDRPFGEKTYYVTPALLTGVVDVTVDTLPAGTIILGAKMVVVAPDVAATSSAADLEIGATGAGDTTLLDGGADFGGAIGKTVGYTTEVTDANLTTINAVSLGGSPLVVNLEISYVGTATTAPTYAVTITCGRNEY
jgi:hypothetical protein